MTSPQPPRPTNQAAAGAVNEETLHLPTTTPGSAAPAVAPAGTPVAAPAAPTAPHAPGMRRTAPSPYPVRPPFRAPAPPPTAPQAAPAAAPRPRPVGPARWEGLGFRPDVQGLRAVAVTLVLLSHAGFAFASGGYVGVDVFFVLSGFLITSLLVKEVFDTGKVSIAGFYARRARRILPAASVVTVATVVGAWLWFPVTRLEAVMQDAFTVIVYVVNYRFIAQETEYLNADQMPSPFQQYWSLAVEEQFYLVWPLLLLGLLLMVKRDPRRLVSAGIAVAVGLFAISLVLSVLVTEQSQPTAYYAAHTRAWELAAGALLALTLPGLKKTPKFLAWVLGIGGLAAIVAAGVLYGDATPFPGYTALLPVAGTMLVIIAGSSAAKNPVSSLLGTGPFQFVGKISYSLYLWHWPILILIPLAVDAEPSILLSTILLLGTIAVAQFSHRYIEEPVRRGKPFKSANLWGLAIGVVSSVAGIAMIVTLTTVYSKVPESDGTDLDAVEEVSGQEQIDRLLEEAADITAAPADLTPALADSSSDRPVIYSNGCHLDTDETEPEEGCVYGDTDSSEVVYLFGDSHAAQWFPALEEIAAEQGWKLVTRTKSACTPVDVTVVNSDIQTSDSIYETCDTWRHNVLDELDETQPEMVVLGTSDAATLANVDGDQVVDEWSAGWTRTLERVGAAVERTVVIGDTPRASGDAAPECVSLHMDDVQECNAEDPYVVGYPDRRGAALDAQEAAGAETIDPLPWFCRDDFCPVIVGNLLVYRDTHHMTTPYARSLTDVLAEALPEI
ncbi:acyltransferase [Glycomyces sp. A-F 0318]|uniref:acyltransferase family protein n=1 Tax=Glycomyces amatae TaxID=2881355 RepID=UPI001E63F09F|nr:acyltransferase family protein [Glycomyces amatae]MCD0444355.1 acyltransferase [Glycomyces amatae]